MLAQETVKNKGFVRFGSGTSWFALARLCLCRLRLLSFGSWRQLQRATHTAAGKADGQYRATHQYS